MKLKSALTIALLTCILNTGSGSDCPCCSETYQEFNFWIGEWTVKDSLGLLLGENSIHYLEDSCIISEHWKGAQGGSGRSYSFYNKKDSSWNQVWIDNTGGILQLKGSFDTDRMIMKSENIAGKTVDYYYNQVSWINNKNGTITQKWEVFDNEENLLRTVFNGIYYRKK